MKILLIAALLATTPAPQWTQDHYGPGHTGYNPAESVVNASTIGKLKLRWTVKPAPGAEGCDPAPVAPLVVDGRAFALDDGGVSAYNTATGKRIWHYRAGYFEGTGLAYANGRLLATDINCFSNSSYDSNVIALDPKTGKEVWNELANWTTDTYVADAGVFVVSGHCGTCDDFEHGTVAFRIADGKRLWQQDNVVLAGPVSAGGRILLSRTTKNESFLAPIGTGEPLWGSATPWTTPAANPAGDQLYLWNAGGLSAVRADSAKALWRIKGETNDLASDGRRVFVASANRVNAYHATTGKLEWTRALAKPATPIRAGGLLYVRSKSSLVILSPVTGKPVTSGKPFGTMTEHVVAAGGQLYAMSKRSFRAYAP